MTNKDLIPVSLVGIFRMNVRFFSLLMSLRIKKTVIYCGPCPAFYFRGRAGTPSPAGTRPREGPQDKEVHCVPRWRARVTAFLPRAVTRQ